MFSHCHVVIQRHAKVTSWALVVVTVLLFSGCRKAETITPFAQDRIELRHVVDGQTYYLADDGNAYREVEPGVSWEYFETVFDPEEVKQAYQEEGGITYRIAPDTKKRFAVCRDLKDSFEDLGTGVTGLAELVSEERAMWGSFTLQSPESPTVADYVALRTEILSGDANFRDARIEPTTEKAHTGLASLKCSVPVKPEAMITCKASLSSPLVYFRDGDDFWFEAYFWAEESLPMTLVDLESEFLAHHSGIRLRIFEDDSLGIELKALDKPQYRQPEAERIAFPKSRWVCVRVHYVLSPTDGEMEVWQDGQMVLSCSGMTLPFRSAIYNSLEIGISAHGNSASSSTLYVDDVRCSASRFLH